MLSGMRVVISCCTPLYWVSKVGLLLTQVGVSQANTAVVINTVTNKVARVLGKDETLRFLNLSLYQGAPAKKGLTTLAMAASANPLIQEKATRDPHLFCTAYKRNRFYLFGKGGE